MNKEEWPSHILDKVNVDTQGYSYRGGMATQSLPPFSITTILHGTCALIGVSCVC